LLRIDFLAAFSGGLRLAQVFVGEAQLFGRGIKMDDAAALGTARDQEMIEGVAAFAAFTSRRWRAFAEDETVA
jgi:flagellar biosynthesis regulator FlaF